MRLRFLGHSLNKLRFTFSLTLTLLIDKRRRMLTAFTVVRNGHTTVSVVNAHYWSSATLKNFVFAERFLFTFPPKLFIKSYIALDVCSTSKYAR
jgi:hypothetical protein